MKKASKAFEIGRHAGTGKLAPVKVARQHPSTYIVEHMPKRGNGDTKKR